MTLARRSRTTSTATLALPTAADAARLAGERHALSLSLLLGTTPAEQLMPGDRARLQALTLDALRRLEDEPDIHAVAAVRAGLAETLARAVVTPTDRGLAILVSPAGAHLYHLRVTPQDRVVLDPTFATRDLVQSATKDPAFLMLVMDGRAARLLHYDQQRTLPVLGDDFPMAWRSSKAAVPTCSMDRAFLREVDFWLAARVRATGLPVVLMANERIAAAFLDVAPSRRIAAVVRGGNANTSTAELERSARAALAQHVTDRVAAALDTAAVRLAHGRAVAGLPAAWAVIGHCEPEVLVVERTHAVPARLDEAGIEFIADPEERDALDDAVDELIEAAVARGAAVFTVPDGSLAQHGRLILAVRGRIPALAG